MPEYGYEDLIEYVMRLSRLSRRNPNDSSFVKQEFSRQKVLHTIYENPGISAGDLARKLDIRPASLTTLLSAMEKQHLLERRKDESDCRCIHVYILEEGKKGVEMRPHNCMDRYAFLKDRFSPEEIDMFCSLSQKLLDTFDSAHKDGCEKKKKEDGAA